MHPRFPAINFSWQNSLQERKQTLDQLREWLKTASTTPLQNELIQTTINYATRFISTEAKEGSSKSIFQSDDIETCRVIFSAARQDTTNFLDILQRQLNQCKDPNHTLKRALGYILKEGNHSNRSEQKASLQPNSLPLSLPLPNPISEPPPPADSKSNLAADSPYSLMPGGPGGANGPQAALLSFPPGGPDFKLEELSASDTETEKNVLKYYAHMDTLKLLKEYDSTCSKLAIRKGLPTLLIQMYTLMVFFGKEEYSPDQLFIAFFLAVCLNKLYCKASSVVSTQQAYETILKELYNRYRIEAMITGPEVTHNDLAMKILDTIHRELSQEQMEPWKTIPNNSDEYAKVSERYLDLIASPPHNIIYLRNAPKNVVPQISNSPGMRIFRALSDEQTPIHLSHPSTLNRVEQNSLMLHPLRHGRAYFDFWTSCLRNSPNQDENKKEKGSPKNLDM